MITKNKLRIAATADIHARTDSAGSLQSLFKDVNQSAEVLLMGGDLTSNGLLEEAEVLAKEIQTCTVPKLAVLGNHDHENGHHEEIRRMLKKAGVVFLDEAPYEIGGEGFVGVKGFGGGFGTHLLSYFGEAETKAFVQAAMDEVKRLEIGLGEIEHTAKKVVLMHYSPIIETLKGEPLEIFPFLGTTRFEEVIDRFGVSVVFHGHAHFGSLQGKTAKGGVVYNVAVPLLVRNGHEKGYRLIEL